MRKGFTRQPDRTTDEHGQPARGPAHAEVAAVKNYITPSGLQRLRDERHFLLARERPAVTQVVAWAASNGDRSENADYQYNKRRLRQIDRRIRFLTKRIDAAEVVDPEAPRRGPASTHIFFGATVRYRNAAGTERVVSIVGLDEVDLDRQHISWLSPLARALMKSGPGDAWSFARRAARSICTSSKCGTRASPSRPSPSRRVRRPRRRRVRRPPADCLEADDERARPRSRRLSNLEARRYQLRMASPSPPAAPRVGGAGRISPAPPLPPAAPWGIALPATGAPPCPPHPRYSKSGAFPGSPPLPGRNTAMANVDAVALPATPA